MPTVHITPESTTLLQELANSLFKAKKVVVVTGAGISTNSGIPDFRSENGLYSLIQAQFDAASKGNNGDDTRDDAPAGTPADTSEERPSKRRRLLYDEPSSLLSEPPSQDCVEVKNEPTTCGTRRRKNSCSSQLSLQDEPAESIVVGGEKDSELPALSRPEIDQAGRAEETASDVVVSTSNGQNRLPRDDNNESRGGSQGVPSEASHQNCEPSEVNTLSDSTHECLPQLPQANDSSKLTKAGECSSSPLSSPQASTPKTSHFPSQSGLPSCLLSSSPLSSPPPILFDPYQDESSSDPTCPLSDSSLPRGSSPSPSGTEDNSESSTPLFTSQSSFASSTSSLATLPNLKGRDLFDSSIWADPVKTSVFYTFTTTLRQKARDVRPTASHQFLSVLRDRRKLVRCYTQNIDQLEERVGLATSLGLGPGSRARFSTKGRVSGAVLPGNSGGSTTGGGRGGSGARGGGGGSGAGSGSGNGSQDTVEAQRPGQPGRETCAGSNPERPDQEKDARHQDQVNPKQVPEGAPVHQEGKEDEGDGGKPHREERPEPSCDSESSQSDPATSAAAGTTPAAQAVRHGQQTGPAKTRSKPSGSGHSGVAGLDGRGHGEPLGEGTAPTESEQPDGVLRRPASSAGPASTVAAASNSRPNGAASVPPAPNRGVECVFLHGSLECLRCFVCARTSSWDEADRELDTMAGRQPTCPHCAGATAAREERGKRALGVGKLRPDIVLYGEEHPHSHLISPIVQHDLSLGPDMLLILGTSLRVHGLKVLVKEFAKAVHNKGGKVVFINYTKPPESVWADVIDFWVQWDCDTWVLDVKSRKPSLWLPPGSVPEDNDPKPSKAKRDSTGGEKREKGRGAATKKAKKEKKEKPVKKEPVEKPMPRPKAAKERKYKPDAKKPVSVRDDRYNGAYLTWRIMKELRRVTGTPQAKSATRRKTRKSAPALLESHQDSPMRPKQEAVVPVTPNTTNESIIARAGPQPAVTPTDPGSSIFAAVKLNPRKRKRKVIGGVEVEIPGSRQSRTGLPPTPAFAISPTLLLPPPTPSSTPYAQRKLLSPTTPASVPTMPTSESFNIPVVLPPMHHTTPPGPGSAARPKPLEPDVGRAGWNNSITARLNPFFLKDPLGFQLVRPPAQKQATDSRRLQGFAARSWGPDQQLMSEQMAKEDAALALSGLKGGALW